ncbi:MAG: hypothetical protein PHS96_03460, partial [Anaerolineales bacterium]|nr:hypothetical protein [Anaerolineales bacterium]
YPSYYPDNPRYYRQHGRIDLALVYFLLYIPLSLKPTLRKLAARWAPEGWLYRLERWVYRAQIGDGEKKIEHHEVGD